MDSAFNRICFSVRYCLKCNANVVKGAVTFGVCQGLYQVLCYSSKAFIEGTLGGVQGSDFCGLTKVKSSNAPMILTQTGKGLKRFQW
jgi:hypothetical protein